MPFGVVESYPLKISCRLYVHLMFCVWEEGMFTEDEAEFGRIVASLSDADFDRLLDLLLSLQLEQGEPSLASPRDERLKAREKRRSTLARNRSSHR